MGGSARLGGGPAGAMGDTGGVLVPVTVAVPESTELTLLEPPPPPCKVVDLPVVAGEPPRELALL